MHKFTHLLRMCAVLTASLALPATAIADDATTITVTRVIVHSTLGTEAIYDLTGDPTIKIVDDNLSITTESNDVLLPLSTVSSLSYDTHEYTTGVAESLVDMPEGFDFCGNNLVFTLNEGLNTIAIYDIKGNAIVDTTIPGHGERIYPITGMTPGVYVVKFNGITYKILKR